MQFVLFKSSNLIMNCFWIFVFIFGCLVNYKWLFIIISLYEVLKVQLAKIHKVNFRPVSSLLLTCFLTIDLSIEWRWGDSNPWPPACKAGALPTELHPHFLPLSYWVVITAWVLFNYGLYPVGLSGLEPPTSRLSGVRSNQLSYKPFCFFY